MYSHPIKIYQGVDNPIQIVVQNQDNKSVDLTGHDLQVYIQDATGARVFATYTVTWADITRGHGSIVIDKDVVDSLDQRLYKITMKKVNIETGATSPAYIDANYGVPIDLEVLPGYFPEVEIANIAG